MKKNQGEGPLVSDLVAENQHLHAVIAEMRERIVALELLADTDTLTPLPNRRAFMRRLETVLQYTARHHTPAAILYIDLDGLKRINDEHGHPAGDAVLLHLAQMLTENLRATDMVARIGGDEFGLILDHLSLEDAQAKAAALSAHVLSRPVIFGGTQIAVRVTIGLAMAQAGESVASLIERADAAMYANRLHRSQI